MLTSRIELKQNVFQRERIPKKGPAPQLSTERWVFQPGDGEVHLEMLRAFCLSAAAITSHSISLFYGHKPAPELSFSHRSVFGNISQLCIYNLRDRPAPYCGSCVQGEHVRVQAYQLTDLKENACVLVVSMDLCAQSTCVKRSHCTV